MDASLIFCGIATYSETTLTVSHLTHFKFAFHIKSQDKDFDESMVKLQSLGTRNTRTESDSEYPFNVKYVLEIPVQYCSKNTELFCTRLGNFICLYSGFLV